MLQNSIITDMPDKDKEQKHKLKEDKELEDVEKDKITPEESSDITPEPVKKEKSILDPEDSESKEEKSSVQPPKVASFSQLDNPETIKPSDDNTTEKTLSAESSEIKGTIGTTETVDKPEGVVDDVKENSSDDIKEWLKEVRPDTSKEVEKKGGPNFKIILLIMITLLILGSVVGGMYYFKKQVNTEVTQPEEQTQEEPSSVPTQVPEEFDLKELSVSVLNGSGVKGEAAAVKTLLSKSGFTEDKIETGNADKTNYENTSVSLKKDVPQSIYDEVKKSLDETYTVEKSDTELEEDSSFDIIVIVGQKKT
ncbi:MAG: hypothetical protein UT08_C0027G0006 [Candidatus Woesebacteria bacterium GW2011_GWB1_38_8]|uniref:LytR/CpsA/Psr regulator C-terminal domain-containing protein n=1 Tax=Candidatus Woesebacteria bacterium GW2011_GWB1_38_8 TaxID=1618570 RepID=A0A0G0NDE6_9BACT|nr:MAG: hypothetical protein UT08_C0027G0006 [Candidatus Woesebacteria bacterium GW2011_GWB1_38_8]